MTQSLPLRKKRVDDVLGDVDPSKAVTTDLGLVVHQTSMFMREMYL